MRRGRQGNGDVNKTHYNPKDDISELKLKIKKLKECLTALDERVTLGNRDIHVLARSNRLKIMTKIESDKFDRYSPESKNQLLDIAMSYLGQDMDPDLYDFVSKKERDDLKEKKKETRSEKTRVNIIDLYHMEDALYTGAKQKRKVLQAKHVGNLSEPLRYLLSRDDVKGYDKDRRELINVLKLSNPEATDSGPEQSNAETNRKIEDLGKKYEKWRDKLSAIHILKANISCTGVKGQKELTAGMNPGDHQKQRIQEREFLNDDRNTSFVESLLKENEKWGIYWVHVTGDQSESVIHLNESATGNLQKALRSAANKLPQDGSEIELKPKDFEKCKIPFLHCDVKINVEGIGVFQPKRTGMDKIIQIQKSNVTDSSVQPFVTELSAVFRA